MGLLTNNTNRVTTKKECELKKSLVYKRIWKIRLLIASFFYLNELLLSTNRVLSLITKLSKYFLRTLLKKYPSDSMMLILVFILIIHNIHHNACRVSCKVFQSVRPRWPHSWFNAFVRLPFTLSCFWHRYSIALDWCKTYYFSLITFKYSV